MTPSDRMLLVIEYLSNAGHEPVKQIDIARDLDIAPATLNRIIRVLSETGYVFRTSERFVVANFRFQRNVPMSAGYLEKLDTIIDEITDTLQVYSETVVVTGQDLFWHSMAKPKAQLSSIRAKAGFRRPLYELDAMSRLYLGSVGWEYVDYHFNSRSFHDNGPGLAPYSSERARELIEGAAGKDFDFDWEGNRVGLRRFALAINDFDGKFLHFLTIAEPAEPATDRDERVEKYHRILTGARDRLIQVMSQERMNAERLRFAGSTGA